MKSVSRQSLYKQVLEQLLNAIVQKEFPPGSQLPAERELMEMMGVGRPSIREALLALQQMGLIEITHGERARVIEPTPEVIIDKLAEAMNILLLTSERGMKELLEARLMLEVGSSRLAARDATDEDLADLEELLQSMRESEPGSRAYVDADIGFHIRIAEISRNSFVVAATRGVLTWLSRHRRNLVSVPGQQAFAVNDHQKVLEAISSRDEDVSAAAMKSHLERASELYPSDARALVDTR